jgi:hypothetical protein
MWVQSQGFATLPQITAYIPGLNLASSGLPRLWNISSSLDLGCPTVLLNTATMKPVMHWAELDYSSNDVPGEFPRALLIWPAEQLNFSTTYVVGLRNLVDDDGIPIAASDGFAALKYNHNTSNPALELSRARFKQIFNQLNTSVGWSKESLTLAWDFTTSNKVDTTGRIVFMRDDATKRVNDGNGMIYGISNVNDSATGPIARTIYGE